MKKLLLVSAALVLATPAWSAQQPITTITVPASGKIDLKTYTNTYVNPRITDIDENTTDLYTNKADKMQVVRYWEDWPSSSPGNVLAAGVVVAYEGELYKTTQQFTKTAGATPVGFGAYFTKITGPSYTLPAATSSALGGVMQGTGVSIAADGTLSVTAAGIGLGTSDNPSFSSVHASGGNLAAANKQVTKAWQTGLSYTAAVTSVIHGDEHYIAKTTHTAEAKWEPGVGASWEDAWKKVSGVSGGTDDQTASEVNITDAGNYFTGTTVEASLQEVGLNYALKSNYLATNNTTAFTPDADYEPATKKYVDDAITAGGGYTDEMAQDAIGGMFAGNTETGIAVTYDDATGKVNFVVSTQFDGTQNTTGSAAKLTTARTIGGVSFDGSTNINLPGVNQSGTQNTSGTAAGLGAQYIDWNASSGGTSIANKPSIAGLATSGITGNLTLSKSGTTARTATFPDAAGTVALTSDIPAAVTDATITTTDVTTNNATTTKHGWLVKATAPASGLRNVVAIDNGETVYTNKALFDATSPSTQAFGDSAVVGSAMTAARRDHKHAMPAAQTATTTAFTPNGSIAATTVQAAIQEVRDEAGAGHSAVTLGTDADVLFDLSTQQITLDSQTANTVFAAPNGSAGDPTFRALVAADIPFAAPGAIGGTTPAAGTFTTVTAATYASTAADGSRRSILPNNTTIACSGSGEEEIYNEAGEIKACENDTEYNVLLSRDIGSAVQAYDADLADLADGSLTGTKVGFADTDNLWTATNVQAALEELNDSINAGAPNGTGAKVHWSQLTGVPAGFADGSDDASGGGITHPTSDGTYYASRNGAWSAFTSGNYTLGMTLTGNTAVTLPTSGTLATTVASGTSALGTSAITSGACASVVTTTATGTATTDVINWGFNSDPTSTTGYSASANGMLTIIAYPSANNVNFKVCNNTAASVTPGAVTLNWRVNR